MVVFHDRNFLNDVTTTTWELENAGVRVFGGNYQFYKEQKGIEVEAREREVIRLESEAKKANDRSKKSNKGPPIAQEEILVESRKIEIDIELIISERGLPKQLVANPNSPEKKLKKA